MRDLVPIGKKCVNEYLMWDAQDVLHLSKKVLSHPTMVRENKTEGAVHYPNSHISASDKRRGT